VRADTGEKCPAAPVASQYETLRASALGEPLPPESRIGLMVILRQGMWGWARALPSARALEEPMRSPLSSSTTPHHHKALIQVLAAVALDFNNGRAQ
jgi:hypothetical protein